MFVCALCKKPLPSDGKCCVEHRFTKNGLSYEPDPLLAKAFPKKHRLYRVLQNNGEVSYRMLAEGSLSLSGRKDVADFAKFIGSNISSGRILDIGCGTLPTPGYLDIPGDFELYGLDPMPCTDFNGVGVTGSAEFLPFPDDYFDAVIFATSLDHVCSLGQTAEETARVLKPGGKVMIWMGDRTETLAQKIIFKLKQIGLSFRDGYRYDRWKVYPNGAVFYIPPGAFDQFHTFRETPAMIERLFVRHGFEHSQTVPVDYGTGKQAFLCFKSADKPQSER